MQKFCDKIEIFVTVATEVGRPRKPRTYLTYKPRYSQ